MKQRRPRQHRSPLKQVSDLTLAPSKTAESRVLGQSNLPLFPPPFFIANNMRNLDSSSAATAANLTRRQALQRGLQAGAALTALNLSGNTALAQAKATPLRVAIIGDGRTGVWATLRSLPEKQVQTAIGAPLTFQPGFTASLPVMEAIKAGSVDFSFATATALVNAIAAKVPMIPLAAYALPADEVDFLVRADSGIRSAADLKGKRIAHQNGTTGTYSLIKYLETAGLRLKDVQAVSLSGVDAYTALAQGSIDGWIHWQHAGAIAKARLGDKVRLLPNVKTYDWAFYVASEKALEANPQAIFNAVKLIKQTQAKINATPEATAQLWAAQGGFRPGSLEERVFVELIRDKRLSDSTADLLAPLSKQAATETQEMADSFQQLGVLPQRTDVVAFLQSSKVSDVAQKIRSAIA